MYGVRLRWEQLPPEVHDAVAQVLGSPVRTTDSQPGGFSPGSADRVVTGDGRRAFVKAVSTAQNPLSPGLHRREGEVLDALQRTPAVLGSPPGCSGSTTTATGSRWSSRTWRAGTRCRGRTRASRRP